MKIYYTESHEWLKGDDGVWIVGITKYAADQLGDITFVELPETGSSFICKDVLCEIESVKAASEIYMPLTGTVEEVNAELITAPEIVNQSPEDSGWLVRIKPESETDLAGLMESEQYEEYLGSLE